MIDLLYNFFTLNSIYDLNLMLIYTTHLYFHDHLCSFEELNWGAVTGKAKVVGTILGFAGALVLTFYKGVEFDIWPFAINLLDPKNDHTERVTDATTELLGVLCVLLSCFCFSIWLIIQVIN